MSAVPNNLEPVPIYYYPATGTISWSYQTHKKLREKIEEKQLTFMKTFDMRNSLEDAGTNISIAFESFGFKAEVCTVTSEVSKSLHVIYVDPLTGKCSLAEDTKAMILRIRGEQCLNYLCAMHPDAIQKIKGVRRIVDTMTEPIKVLSTKIVQEDPRGFPDHRETSYTFTPQQIKPEPPKVTRLSDIRFSGSPERKESDTTQQQKQKDPYMCRLAGISSTRNIPVSDIEQILYVFRDLWKRTQPDGFGWAIHGKHGRYVERFVKPDDFRGINRLAEVPKKFGKMKIPAVDSSGKFSRGGPLIIHGRTSTNTVGIKNTHPLSKSNWSLVHNGVVQWFGDVRPTETDNDTEHLLNCFALGKGVEDFSEMSGYAAWLAITPDGRLEAGKSDYAPLHVSYVKKWDAYIMASDPDHVDAVLRKIGVNGTMPIRAEDNIILKFTENGSEFDLAEHAGLQSQFSGANCGSMMRRAFADDDDPWTMVGGQRYQMRGSGYQSQSATTDDKKESQMELVETQDADAVYGFSDKFTDDELDILHKLGLYDYRCKGKDDVTNSNFYRTHKSSSHWVEEDDLTAPMERRLEDFIAAELEKLEKEEQQGPADAYEPTEEELAAIEREVSAYHGTGGEM